MSNLAQDQPVISRAAGEDEACNPGTTGRWIREKKLVCTSHICPDLLYPIPVLWQNTRQRRCSPGDVLAVLLSETPQALRAQELSKADKQKRLVLTNL